jgi:hypothetical protein
LVTVAVSMWKASGLPASEDLRATVSCGAFRGGANVVFAPVASWVKVRPS